MEEMSDCGPLFIDLEVFVSNKSIFVSTYRCHCDTDGMTIMCCVRGRMVSLRE